MIMATGSTLGFTAIALGAFGAHAFKKILPEEKLQSFETGVRYQFYNALFILIIGLTGKREASLIYWSYILGLSGTLLFSISIYFLSFADHWKKNLRFLGPITPLGGLLMLAGWLLFGLYYFLEG